MNDGNVTMMGRLRAGLASMLAGLAAGARRMEHWSARGTRPIFVGLLAIALLAFGALAIVSGGHFFGGWGHRGPHPMEARGGPAQKPIGKPEGKPEDRREGRSDGGSERGFQGRSEGKPEAPRPPGPPAPPAPPAGARQ